MKKQWIDQSCEERVFHPKFLTDPLNSQSLNDQFVNFQLDRILAFLKNTVPEKDFYIELMSFLTKIQPINRESSFSGLESAAFQKILFIVQTIFVFFEGDFPSQNQLDFAMTLCNISQSFIGEIEKLTQTKKSSEQPVLTIILRIVFSRSLQIPLSKNAVENIQEKVRQVKNSNFQDWSFSVSVKIFFALKDLRAHWISNQLEALIELDFESTEKLSGLDDELLDFQIDLLNKNIKRDILDKMSNSIQQTVCDKIIFLFSVQSKFRYYFQKCEDSAQNNPSPSNWLRSESVSRKNQQLPKLDQIAKKFTQIEKFGETPNKNLLNALDVFSAKSFYVGIFEHTVIDVCTANYHILLVSKFFSGFVQKMLLICFFRRIKKTRKMDVHLLDRIKSLSANPFFKTEPLKFDFIQSSSMEIFVKYYELKIEEKISQIDIICDIEQICETMIEHKNSFVLFRALKSTKDPLILRVLSDALIEILRKNKAVENADFRDFSDSLCLVETEILLLQKSGILKENIEVLKDKTSALISQLKLSKITVQEKILIEAELLLKKLFLEVSFLDDKTDIVFELIYQFLTKIANLTFFFFNSQRSDILHHFANSDASLNHIIFESLKQNPKLKLEIPPKIAYLFFILTENAICINQIYECEFSSDVFYESLLLICFQFKFPEQIFKNIEIRAIQNKNNFSSSKQIDVISSYFLQKNSQKSFSSLEISTVLTSARIIFKENWSFDDSKAQLCHSIMLEIHLIIAEISKKIENNTFKKTDALILIELNIIVLDQCRNFVAVSKVVKEINYLFNQVWDKKIKKEFLEDFTHLETLNFKIDSFHFFDAPNVSNLLMELRIPFTLQTVLTTLKNLIKSFKNCGIYSAVTNIQKTYSTISKNIKSLSHFYRSLRFDLIITRDRTECNKEIKKYINFLPAEGFQIVEKFNRKFSWMAENLRIKILKLVIESSVYCNEENSLLDCFEMQKKKQFSVLTKNGFSSNKPDSFVEIFGFLEKICFGELFQAHFLSESILREYFSEKDRNYIAFNLQKINNFKELLSNKFQDQFLKFLTLRFYEAYLSKTKSSSIFQFELSFSYYLIFEQLFVFSFDLNCLLLAKDILSVFFSILTQIKKNFLKPNFQNQISRKSDLFPSHSSDSSEINPYLSFLDCLVRFINHEQMFRYIYKKSFLVEKRTSFVFRKSIKRHSVNNNMSISEFKTNSVLLLWTSKDETTRILTQSNLELLSDFEEQKKSDFYFICAFENEAKIVEKFIFYGFYSFENQTDNFVDVIANKALYVI